MTFQSRIAYWIPRVGYGCGSASRGFAYTSVSIFYLFYLTNMLGLAPALAGTVLALPKVWDAFVDPVLGTWVDRQATRVGKRWPFLLVAGLLAIAAYVGMFSLPKFGSPWTIAAVALVLLVVNSMAETVFAVCHLSISAEITKDSADLTSLFSLTTTLFTIVTIVGSMLPPLLIATFGGGRSGYSHMALVGGGISCLLLLAFIAMTWRVPVSPIQKDAAKLSLLASFKATSTNRSFVYLLAYFIVVSVGTSVLNAFTPYANLYVLHGGPGGLAIFGGLTSGAAIVGYQLAPLLVRRTGVEGALRFGNVSTWATYALLFVTSFGALWLNWGAIAVVGIVSGVMSVLILAALVGVSRTPIKGTLVVPMGFYYGLIVSGLKLGVSAGGIVSGFWLAAVGFDPGNAHQTSAAIMGIRSGYTLLLFAIFACAGVLVNRIRMGSEQSIDITAAEAVLTEAH